MMPTGDCSCRRKVMQPLSGADAFKQGCRVIAFDRPPFGLTERPLHWSGGDAMSPYTSEVCTSCDMSCLNGTSHCMP